MKEINEFLNEDIITFGQNGHLSPKMILIIIVVFIITAVILKVLKKLITRKLPEEDKPKFTSVFSFTRYFIYLVVILIAMDNMGINVTAIFAASAALLVGVGLALQTFFQDIISGIFILVDQSVHVGDIIEIDGKVGRVVEIKLRTTRAVTIDNKVLVIPNHKYLTSILYNWTENGTKTRESVSVGVAYGSDVELVKKILLEVANNHPAVLKKPEPIVLFMNFGDSSLDFKLVFTLNNSFEAIMPQSDIRFKINEMFQKHDITIPFPQRDVHVFNK
ncbi:mechanosensitive ion channel family protein [Pontimicrobium sp. IMCC45349]|jgi:small-conductance mechanosensitive channel|uniref:mechanosensitive ion channel family protein n=1 Tax=Pontimicrobium sp. IMCC45349 TaxID=3391574 RepID=UPI0039A38B34